VLVLRFRFTQRSCLSCISRFFCLAPVSRTVSRSAAGIAVLLEHRSPELPPHLVPSRRYPPPSLPLEGLVGVRRLVCKHERVSGERDEAQAGDAPA
jgi:hypothetical protein